MAARYDKVTRCKRRLKELDSHDRRLSLIWGWAKDNTINFGEFKELLAYLEKVEDEKDREFAEAKILELREQLKQQRILQES